MTELQKMAKSTRMGNRTRMKSKFLRSCQKMHYLFHWERFASFRRRNIRVVIRNGKALSNLDRIVKDQRLFEVRMLSHTWRPAFNVVSEELVELVHHVYTQTTTVQRHVGAPVKPGRVWLDILVPYGPPPEYEQSGYVRPHVGRRQKRKEYLSVECELTCEQLRDN